MHFALSDMSDGKREQIKQKSDVVSFDCVAHGRCRMLDHESVCTQRFMLYFVDRVRENMFFLSSDSVYIHVHITLCRVTQVPAAAIAAEYFAVGITLTGAKKPHAGHQQVLHIKVWVLVVCKLDLACHGLARG